MTEADLKLLVQSIPSIDEEGLLAARDRLDSLTKPPGSLGRLEDVAARVAAIQHTVRPDVRSKAIIVMAGDHGVVVEGVSPYPQEVTGQMVRNFLAGGAAINQLAGWAGAEMVVVDVGVAGDVPGEGDLRRRKVAPGTRNMTQGPAMSVEEALAAIQVGVETAWEAVDAGARIVGTGEMGIGNTTSASALTCAFTGSSAEKAVGRGTGLPEDRLAHKADVVRRALRANAPDLPDALRCLAALGGLEIAGLTGVVLGCAARSVPVVADGFISGAAALAALRIAPGAGDYLFASHLSAEPGHAVVLEAIGARPVLELDMRLGEGTGAALAMGVIDAACRTMSGMATFGEAGVSGEE